MYQSDIAPAINATIRPAKEADSGLIAHIGRLGVDESHRESCSTADMQTFLAATYNNEAIRADIADPASIYHLIYQNDNPAGFSRIVLNAHHPNIVPQNVTKLDRIYLLKEYYGMKLGLQLLNFNIHLSMQQNQCGMWLFTWVGNERAIRFYKSAGFDIVGGHRFKVSDTHYNVHHQMLLRY